VSHTRRKDIDMYIIIERVCLATVLYGNFRQMLCCRDKITLKTRTSPVYVLSTGINFFSMRVFSLSSTINCL